MVTPCMTEQLQSTLHIPYLVLLDPHSDSENLSYNKLDHGLGGTAEVEEHLTKQDDAGYDFKDDSAYSKLDHGDTGYEPIKEDTPYGKLDHGLGTTDPGIQECVTNQDTCREPSKEVAPYSKLDHRLATAETQHRLADHDIGYEPSKQIADFV